MINERKILELVKRQKETGLTVTAFCSNEGIHKSTFYNWLKKLNKEPEKRFIPLMVNSTHRNVSAKDFTIGDIEHHNSCDDFLLELIYPNGTRLRIKSDPDLNHLRSLVCLLG